VASISGRVKIVGDLRTSSSEFIAKRVVTDAENVRIHLLRPDGTLDSTLTRDGYFQFAVTEHGPYRAIAWAHPHLADSSAVYEFTGANITIPDTLVIEPTELITVYPNPTADSVGIEFLMEPAHHVTVYVEELSGKVLWSYEFVSGDETFEHVEWPGTDNDGHAVPAGMYWIVIKAEPQVLAARSPRNDGERGSAVRWRNASSRRFVAMDGNASRAMARRDMRPLHGEVDAAVGLLFKE
jgi:hypothetical protein